jgi:uncharacterized protein involved in outer membrane biogenesis
LAGGARPAFVITRTIFADRRLHWAAGTILGIAVVTLLVLAMFPWGALRSMIEAQLRDRFGPAVTIGSIERLDMFSFTPTIRIRNVRIPQAEWAGRGDLARIEQADVTFRALPLLIGRFRPDAIRVSGMHLALVRAADTRENWSDGKDGGSSGSGGRISRLSIVDSTISYRDAKADRSFTAAVSADTARGLRLSGTGVVRGFPVKIEFKGAAIKGLGNRPWPFAAKIDGPALGMEARGTMVAPLDTHGMTLDLTAHAADLKMLDGVIEAGLFGTQPVRLKAHVRRDSPDWIITGLSGTIGGSDLTGRLDVKKRDGRTNLSGNVAFGTLNFDDLSTDAGLAKGRALERAIGPRLIPATRINIGKIDRTDGVITVSAKRIVDSSGPSTLTSLAGKVTMNRQLLLFSPLRIGLRTGAITGSIRVDQRGGRPEPQVTFDLALRDSNVAAIAGNISDVEGRVEGRARLTGTGDTIREAIGRSSGKIGLFARDGSLPVKIAAMIGFDAGRALTADERQRAALRCMAIRLDVRNGTGRADPLLIDTSESQSRGQGTVSFPSEALAIRLTGTPKRDTVLRLPGSVSVNGSIRAPEIVVPREVKSAGNILKAIGRAISGKQDAVAGDADCPALSAQVLGR